MKTNKYDKINKPLSEELSKLLTHFAGKAKTESEEKTLILMAKEIWNISYFDERAQEKEIESFVNSLKIDGITAEKYKKMMLHGIKNKKAATKNIDLNNVWTRVENLKAWKTNGIYKFEFEFEFYE